MKLSKNRWDEKLSNECIVHGNLAVPRTMRHMLHHTEKQKNDAIDASNVYQIKSISKESYMVLRIPLNEAIELIKIKIPKLISLRTVNAHTINIGYEASVKLKFIGVMSKTIHIDFIIDKVDDTDIHFHYTTGIIGGDSLINALLPFLSKSYETNVVDRCDNGHMTLHLREVDQLKILFEKIKINSISFEQDFISIDFTPKICIS